MSFSLTSKFFANARGLTFADGNGITWSINKSTNAITASYSGAGSAGGANPTAKVGLVAANGSAATFMRSDGAPPVDESIAPTWTGQHTFEAASGVPVVIKPASSTYGLEVSTTAGNYAAISLQGNGAVLGSSDFAIFQNTDGSCQIAQHANKPLSILTNGTLAITISAAQAVTCAGEFAMNGATPAAALSGFGSPSGTVTSGLTSAATLAQTAGTLAALLAYLKTIGVIAA